MKEAKKIVCIFARTNERYDFIFFFYLCLSTGILSLLMVCTAIEYILHLPSLSDRPILCLFVLLLPLLLFFVLFTFADIVFYPRTFNFPFDILQTQPKCILLLIDLLLRATFFPLCYVCACVGAAVTLCYLSLVALFTVFIVDLCGITVSYNETLYTIKTKRSGKRKKRAQTNWRNATKPKQKKKKLRNENFSFNFLATFTHSQGGRERERATLPHQPPLAIP